MFKAEVKTDMLKPARIEVRRYTQKSTNVYIIAGKFYYNNEVIYRESQYKVPNGERYSLPGFDFASDMLNRFIYNRWNNIHQRLGAVILLYHMTEKNRRRFTSAEAFESRKHYITGLHNELLQKWTIPNY